MLELKISPPHTNIHDMKSLCGHLENVTLRPMITSALKLGIFYHLQSTYIYTHIYRHLCDMCQIYSLQICYTYAN